MEVHPPEGQAAHGRQPCEAVAEHDCWRDYLQRNWVHAVFQVQLPKGSLAFCFRYTQSVRRLWSELPTHVQRVASCIVESMPGAAAAALVGAQFWRCKGRLHRKRCFMPKLLVKRSSAGSSSSLAVARASAGVPSCISQFRADSSAVNFYFIGGVDNISRDFGSRADRRQSPASKASWCDFEEAC